MALTEMHDRSRHAEDDYFRRRDAELLEKARATRRAAAPRDAAADRSRQALADALGIPDSDIVARLHDAGIRPSTAVLVEWLPIVEVAWIDHIDARERQAIRRLFAADPRGPAGLALLTEWLFVEPAAEVFDAARQALRVRADSLDRAGREALRRRIVFGCEAVGRASGGVMGMGMLSWAEQDRIDAIDEQVDGATLDAGAVEAMHP